MLTWIQANIGTIAVLLVLIAIVAGIVAVMVRDKRSGKHSCGAGCKNCAMHGSCRGGCARH